MRDFNPQEYWEDRLKSAFGLHGVGYIGLGKNYNNWLYKVRRNVFNKKIRKLNIKFKEAEVLDIGSGTGFYIDRWMEIGVKSITGSDLTNIAVQNLKQKYPEYNFCHLDIGSDIRNLHEQKFDIISTFDVLFHIVDDDRYQDSIENVYSLLKPEGFFIFSDLFLHGNTVRATHMVSRKLIDIQKILIDVGFKIIQRTPMFVIMNNPVDSKSKYLKNFWKITEKIIREGEIFGYLIGLLLFPVELMAVFLLKESPTTEMMICQRPK